MSGSSLEQMEQMELSRRHIIYCGLRSVTVLTPVIVIAEPLYNHSNIDQVIGNTAKLLMHNHSTAKALKHDYSIPKLPTHGYEKIPLLPYKPTGHPPGLLILHLGQYLYRYSFQSYKWKVLFFVVLLSQNSASRVNTY